MMNMHLQEPHLMEITPQGVRHPRSGWSRQAHKLRREFEQALYLIRWQLMERTFGRMLGPLWVILDPIVQSAVYFFVLTAVFNIRGTDVAFMAILSSITLWKLHANLLYSAPTLLIGRAAVLQQTNFPVSVILMEFMGTEFCLFLMNFAIIAIVLAATGVLPNPAWLYLPFVIFTQMAFTLLCVLVVTGTATFLRDLNTVVNILTTMWFYGSPIVYGMERLPDPYRTILEYTNPFCHILPAYRAILFDAKVTNIWPLVIILGISIVGLWLVSRVMDQVRIRMYQYL
jgi:homopolymeric O-antigen transport system permease protein